MSSPDLPSDPRLPPSGGGNFADFFRARYGRIFGMIFALTGAGIAGVRFSENPIIIAAIVGMVCFAIVASIYCAKNDIH